MAILPLVYEPDTVLRKKAAPVVQFDDKLVVLAEDMFETMYANKGCGLAAPQVGISLAFTVIDMQSENSEKYVLANPEIIEGKGEHQLEVGCLSVPGAFAKVKRYSWVKVKAQNLKGEWFEVEGEEIFAECLQHEIDHLNGKLFVDHLSSLKRNLLVEKSRKFRKRSARNSG